MAIGTMLFFLLVLPAVSRAQQNPQAIVFINNSATNSTSISPPTCDPPKVSVIQRNNADLHACHFTSILKELLAVDVRALGNDHTVATTVQHVINFQIDTQNRPWAVQVAHQRRGFLQTRNDGGHCAQADLSRIDAPITGGAYNPDDFRTTMDWTTGLRCTDSTVPISESKVGTITGPGSTGLVTVEIKFSWTATAFSDAGFTNGGEEAVVGLGLARNVDCGGAVKDIIEAATYDTTNAPGKDYGHYVTVNLLSSDCLVPVINGYPTECGPLTGPPCTFTMSGTIQGSPGNNYTVLVNYLDSNQQVVCNQSVVVQDGNPNWSSQVTCPIGCDRVVGYAIGVTNDPGLTYDGVNLEHLNGRQIGPIVRGTVIETSPTCQRLAVPAMGEWSRIVAALVLLVGGIFLIHRTRIANGRGHA